MYITYIYTLCAAVCYIVLSTSSLYTSAKRCATAARDDGASVLTHTHTHVYIYTLSLSLSLTHICIRIHLCIYSCLSLPYTARLPREAIAPLFLPSHTHTYIYTYTYIYTHTHTHENIYTYTFIYIYSCLPLPNDARLTREATPPLLLLRRMEISCATCAADSGKYAAGPGLLVAVE